MIVRLRRLNEKGGFTLVELGVVLAVMAVVASTVLPDFIESLKNELAVQAADQVMDLHAAARTYYHNSVKDIENPAFIGAIDPSIAIWPSEEGANTCNIGERELRKGVHGKGAKGDKGKWEPDTVLVDLGLIDLSQTVNPWGKPIAMRLMPSGSALIDEDMRKVLCTMVVATELPIEMANILRARLPGAHCNDAALCGDKESAEAEFVRCCSAMTKPGLEVALERSMVEKYDPVDVKIFMPPP